LCKVRERGEGIKERKDTILGTIDGDNDLKGFRLNSHPFVTSYTTYEHKLEEKDVTIVISCKFQKIYILATLQAGEGGRGKERTHRNSHASEQTRETNMDPEFHACTVNIRSQRG
jgi:hypothetical protein